MRGDLAAVRDSKNPVAGLIEVPTSSLAALVTLAASQ
ncbi:hypothetical protein [Actinokineospora sp. UTMC 2448]|nr:hypothetical protein [Actinokineospora sp. UTMC 2448]